MRLGDLSVRGKLLLITMVSSTMAITILSIALIGWDQMEARRTLEREVNILAGIIGDRSTAALSFVDRQVANENLAALALRQSIVCACIYDAGGNLFGRFERRAEPGAGCPDPLATEEPREGTRVLVVARRIELDGEGIGTILLRSDLHEIEQKLRRQIAVSLFLLLLAGGAALVASLRLQRIISKPLEELAITSRAISEHGDFSVRVDKRGDDELGTLIDAFNTMVGTIEGQSRGLVRANKDLARTVAELESKNAELERFTYTVSHDLKAPLVTIKGFLGMARRDAGAGRLDRMDRDFETIHRAADTMAELLDDVLELSRIGRIVGETACVPFRQLVDEALALLSGRIAESHTEVVVGPIDHEVLVDRRRIVEVLQNLVENGIKFSPGEEPPSIEVGQRESSDGPVFYVTDHGLGIEERYQSQIFEIFERLETGIPGTGVGLAIVKRIIDLHGGKIWVESEGPGHGSTFCLTLPWCNKLPSEKSSA